MSTLILTDPLERGLLNIARSEGLLAADDQFWQMRFADQLPVVDNATRAHLFANLFLHPEVKIGLRYEIPVPVQTDLLRFNQDDDANYDQRFTDMSLLIGYCLAVDPTLTPERIADLIDAYNRAQEAVVSAWGRIPTSDGKGNPVLLTDVIARTLTKVEPSYSAEQHATYQQYSVARDNVDTILRCISDLDHLWHMRTDDNPVSFHPGLARSYGDILANAPANEDELSETDLFFLTIKSLRTLPVGETLTQTLELGATKEGQALRARVAELHGELTGGKTDLATLTAKIDSDADRYRTLTARLKSPHFLSNYIDMALSGLGLIPVVGSYASMLSLTRSGWATRSTHKTRAELKSLAYAEFQGRAI